MENIRFSNYSYVEKMFQCIQKKLGRTSINASFSLGSYKNNVLAWGMFMTSSMKAAIHLGPDFLENSEIYKNTKFENIEKMFKHFSKMNKRALCRNSECKDPGLSFTLMDKINTVRRQRGQVGEGKSLYLRRFSSICGYNRTESMSRRCKMDRTN